MSKATKFTSKIDESKIDFCCGRCFIASTHYERWNCKIYSLPTYMLGRKVRCPCCSTKIVIPKDVQELAIAHPTKFPDCSEEYEIAKQWHKQHNYEKFEK